MILVMSIVPYSCGELITAAAKEKGACGGTILMGKGTAQSNILQLLGFGNTSKDVTYNIVDESIVKDVCANIKSVCSDKKTGFGVMFTIKVDSFLRSGNFDKSYSRKKEGDSDMADSYQLINIIVNKGFAEDAMAAARNAGATGGTIIQARGTAKEGDAKFFGAEIVPEKDMLMILVPSADKDKIVNAIKELPCLQKAGSGIVFCNDAQDFTVLGKQKQ